MKRGTILILLGFVFIAAAAVLMIHNRQEEKQAETAAAEVMEALRQEITPAEENLPAVPYIPEKERSGEQAAQEGTIRENDSKSSVVYPDYVLDPDRAMPEIAIDGYRYIGYLEVPSLGISQPVQSEWSYPNLQISACRYFGSVYQNNMVVCGHNYFPGFGLLSNVAAGDLVQFIDADGNVFNYEVAQVELLSPDETLRMIESEWDLTLFTCTMSTVSRVTVRCVAADKT